MMENHKILKVSAKGFILTCEFEDGNIVRYDMTDVKFESGPMIEPLKDLAFFAKVFISSGALAWPNGYEICPNTVYKSGQSKKK